MTPNPSEETIFDRRVIPSDYDCEHEWEDTAIEKCPVCGSTQLQTVELPSNRLQDNSDNDRDD